MERWEIRVLRTDGSLERVIRRMDAASHRTVSPADLQRELERRL